MRVLIVTAAAAIAAAPPPAIAGPLLIGPTTVQFAPGRRGAMVEVTNQSAGATTLQLRAFAWSQVDGRDRLEPASDLIVSPPIVTVPPHARQVFRILAGSGPGASERSYRLKLNELPSAAGSAVTINVEFSLPVFVTPPGATPTLSSRLDGEAISVTNTGTRHLHLAALEVLTADGTTSEVEGSHGLYVLAGATRRLPLASRLRGAGITRIAGMTDAGPIDVPSTTLAAR